MDRQAALMEMYRAFNAEDVDGALVHLAPGVDWTNDWEGGRVVGRDAVRELWTRQFAATNTEIQPMSLAVEADGGIRAHVHRLITSKTGGVIDNEKVDHLFEFDGPFIRRMTIVAVPIEDEEEEE